MNKYRMLCLDIDGTLLNSRHQISEGTKRAIRKLDDSGDTIIVLISARMPKGMRYLAEELNLNSPLVSYNGAYITQGDQILHARTIKLEQCITIFQLAIERGLHVSLYTEDQWYVEHLDSWALQESEITGIKPIVIEFEKLFSDWEAAGNTPNKILCMGEPGNISVFGERLNFMFEKNLNVYQSKPTYLEIVSAEASKINAIAYLCDRYHINKDEVVAVGDNYNDISMISYAGLGIAMGNAPDEVKKCADYVTLSNDEDGVAWVIDGLDCRKGIGLNK